MTERYEIFRSTQNQQYYFRLRAPNNEIILASEGYLQKSGCENGIASCKTHSPFDQYYEKRTAQNQRPYFVLRAANNQIIGTSQTYSSTYARDQGIAAVKTYGKNAPIVDLT
ncbi:MULTISPECIES: YegP family protein [Pseudomonas]|uniref:YegP family protein n=1 Tax=Pseudomonas wuhanensis TaxID=2954098 RepID=A0ABY9GUD1_9PSED|nr:MULTISPECIES: YegP family protein [unclassified Pseudomonas]WLI13436.1 YegP family protein [Pseudomonas sp. FP603]WLI19323.1 YegP family protein [Pseudomonas sp. FP607]